MMENTSVITIEVKELPGSDDTVVTVYTETGIDYGDLMSACECLINVVAKESDLEYGEACEKLVEGSKEYSRHRAFKIIEGRKDEEEV